MASGSWDTLIKIWNLESGVQIAELKGHSESVNSVAYSYNRKILASASIDETIKIWHVESGT